MFFVNITDIMDFKTFSITYINGRINAIPIKIKYHVCNRGGDTMGKIVIFACGSLSIRIPAATDLSLQHRY